MSFFEKQDLLWLHVVFAVSPLTGHVIGTGGFKVVSSPSRPGEALAFYSHR